MRAEAGDRAVTLRQCRLSPATLIVCLSRLAGSLGKSWGTGAQLLGVETIRPAKEFEDIPRQRNLNEINLTPNVGRTGGNV